MNKRVVHVTSVHRPDDVRIFQKEARSLASVGYDVVVLALDSKRASGEIQERTVEGVRIISVPLGTVKSRLKRMTLGVYQLYKMAHKLDAAVYHLHDPELLPLGFVLRGWGKRVIYDVHEDLPKQILAKPWIPQPLRGVVARAAFGLEKIAGRWINGFVAATPTIATRFPASKTVIVQNFPIVSELTPQVLMPYKQRPHHVVYVGGISKERGLFQMIKAMERLSSPSQAKLILAGEFASEALEREARSLPGWKYVEFLGWQNRGGVQDILSKSRIGLVVLHPMPNYWDGLPIKLFEYMAAGIPVVASDFPLWRRIVEDAGCGLLVNPLDPDAIAGAIDYLLSHPEEAEEMGKRGLRAVEEKYNWEREKEKLLVFYERFLEKDDPGSW